MLAYTNKRSGVGSNPVFRRSIPGARRLFMAEHCAPFSMWPVAAVDTAAVLASSSAYAAVCLVRPPPACSTICQSPTHRETSEGSASFAKRSCIDVWPWPKFPSSRAIAMSRFHKVSNA